MKISEILPRFLKWQLFNRGISAKTCTLRKSVLLRFGRDMGEKDIRGIFLEDVWNWRGKLEKEGLNANTVKHYILTVKSFFQFCWDEKIAYLDYTKIKSPKIPIKRVEYLTPEEVEKYLAGLKNLKYRALIECLISTGTRISELLAINREDIEDEEVKIISAKNKMERTVVFTDRAIYWLKKYLKTRKDDNPALFLSGLGKRLAIGTVENVLRLYREVNGFEKKITPHIFRHTCGTWLYNKTKDLCLTKDYLGHTSIAVTDRYYRGIDEEKIKLAARNNLVF